MKKKAAILLIDDEINIIKALKRVLMDEDYEIHSTTSSTEAVKMIDCNKYDVIMCDQKMPGLSGIDILEYSSKVSPNTMRILITGYSDFKVMEDAINKCKIHYYCPKPWDNDMLVSEIHKVLNEKRANETKEGLVNNILGCKKSLEEILNVIENTGKVDKSHNGQNDSILNSNINIISVKKDDSIVLLVPSEIYYLAAESGRVAVIAENDRYYSWDTLKEWEEKLKCLGFIRCHRSYLVNVEKIKSITPWFEDTYNIKFKDIPDEIYSSKAYIKNLKKFIFTRP